MILNSLNSIKTQWKPSINALKGFLHQMRSSSTEQNLSSRDQKLLPFCRLDQINVGEVLLQDSIQVT